MDIPPPLPSAVYPGIVPSAEAQSAVTGLLVKDLKETEVVRSVCVCGGGRGLCVCVCVCVCVCDDGSMFDSTRLD